MDIFSHMFFSWLLCIGYKEQGFTYYYVLFGALMGMAPDLDIFMYPLAKRFKWLSHRGASHSLILVLIYVPTSAGVASWFWGGSIILLSIMGIIAAYFHILMDLITNYGIAMLYPLRKRFYKLDIERAINPYILVYSLIVFSYISYLRSPNYGTFTYYVDIIPIGRFFLGIFLVYLVARGLIKFNLSRKYKRKGERLSVLPTSSLFKWDLVRMPEDENPKSLVYTRIRLLSRGEPKMIELTRPLGTKRSVPPINLPREAIEFTFQTKEVQDYFNRLSHPVASVKKSGEEWVVSWLPVEFIFGSRAPGLQVVVDKEGNYTARRKFHKLSEF